MIDRRNDRPLEVLLVEDNRGDVRLIEEGFEECGVDRTLWVATDGEEALDVLLRREPYESTPRPDVVLLDLNLPRMNGLDVLVAIRGTPELRDLPVVVLTSSQSESDRAACDERGADGYLSKPVDPADFAAIAREIEAFVTTGRPSFDE